MSHLFTSCARGTVEVISARIFHWNSEQVLNLSPMARKREEIGRGGGEAERSLTNSRRIPWISAWVRKCLSLWHREPDTSWAERLKQEVEIFKVQKGFHMSHQMQGTEQISEVKGWNQGLEGQRGRSWNQVPELSRMSTGVPHDIP